MTENSRFAHGTDRERPRIPAAHVIDSEGRSTHASRAISATPWSFAQPAPERLRRVLERATGTLLLITCAVVAVAFVEPLFHAWNAPRVELARRGIREVVRAHGASVDEPDRAGHPRISGGTLEIVPAIRTFQLRSHAADEAPAVHEVAAGASVSVVRVVKEWALVAAMDGPRAVFGWARTRELGVP